MNSSTIHATEHHPNLSRVEQYVKFLHDNFDSCAKKRQAVDPELDEMTWYCTYVSRYTHMILERLAVMPERDHLEFLAAIGSGKENIDIEILPEHREWQRTADEALRAQFSKAALYIIV
jgi:hypothetical protein|nr:MAG TPA: hypothetical protein [Caudoviricetes sp.]